ncbi:MAG TPA: hypothetical protein PK095_22670, partial [Myxococcota bacterium]|nr:hypothetical protein [Myxococcota bacterium]
MWKTSVIALALLPALACEEQKTGGQILPELAVVSATPGALVPGSRLIVSGRGFVVPEAAEIYVQLDGFVADAP